MRRYVASDLPEINSWYAARGMDAVPDHAMPEVGFIAPGVAAGFLYRTDSSLAFLDGAITNPTAPLRARATEMRRIIAALCNAGEGKTLVGITGLRSMGREVQRLGFNAVGTREMYSRLSG